MDNKLFDVPFEDVNKKYYTIDEVSNILKINQSTIVFYFEKLNDFLNIASVGMYQLFDDKDVENLKKIRDLEQTKNMSMSDIRKYLMKNKQEVLLKKEPNNKVDQSVLNIFQTFANALIEQNAKIDKMHNNSIQLIESINVLIEHQVKIEKDLKDQKELNQKQLEEYSINKQELAKQLNNMQKELAITKDINKNLEEQKHEINNNFTTISEKLIEEHKKSIEEIKTEFKYIKTEELNNQNQGFFSKLFGKKK